MPRRTMPGAEHGEAIPPAGPLSQMLLTALVPALGVGAALLHIGFRARLLAPFDEALLTPLGLSVGVMILHKFECFFAREYDSCPVYLNLERAPFARSLRRALFVSFVAPFLVLLLLMYAVALGAPWHWLTIGAWLGQGLHELHHVARSLSRRRPYPGVATAIIFVCVMHGMVWPATAHALGLASGWGSWLGLALTPTAMIAFYLEDRAWLRKRAATHPAPSPLRVPRNHTAQRARRGAKLPS